MGNLVFVLPVWAGHIVFSNFFCLCEASVNLLLFASLFNDYHKQTSVCVLFMMYLTFYLVLEFQNRFKYIYVQPWMCVFYLQSDLYSISACCTQLNHAGWLLSSVQLQITIGSNKVNFFNHSPTMCAIFKIQKLSQILNSLKSIKKKIVVLGITLYLPLKLLTWRWSEAFLKWLPAWVHTFRNSNTFIV